MERAGADVVAACRIDPLTGSLSRFGSPLRSGLAIARSLPALARAYRAAPPHDAVYVGPGGFIEAAFLGGRILKGRRARGDRPAVIFDPLYSLHDTLVSDRGLVPRTGIRARAIRWLESSALGAADRILVDTDATGDFLAAEYGLARERFRRLRVGSIFDEVRRPRRPQRLPGAPLDVLYVGSYIPLHGLDVVMAAAQRLRDSGIRFTLVGSGQDERRIAAAVRERDLRHVRLEGGFVGGHALLDLYASADAALGIFGTSDKARRVVPFKVNDAMALSLPLVTADTSAAREVLADGESALLVKPGSPDLLALALLRLRDDPALRLRLGRGARAAFDATASAEAAAFEMQVALEGLGRPADEPRGEDASHPAESFN
jgi:glycosyltransferase involved in cell wall biosynthesis